MIRPEKYLDLNTCTIRVASIILSELQQNRVVLLDELDTVVQARLGETARFNFLPALSFLFLLGALEYDLKTDTIYFLLPITHGPTS
jgi:hypothetical protein